MLDLVPFLVIRYGLAHGLQWGTATPIIPIDGSHTQLGPTQRLTALIGLQLGSILLNEGQK